MSRVEFSRALEILIERRRDLWSAHFFCLCRSFYDIEEPNAHIDKSPALKRVAVFGGIVTEFDGSGRPIRTTSQP